MRKWKIWKTIRLGLMPRIGDAICDDLKSSNYLVSDSAKDLLGKQAYTDSLVSKEMDVDLVVVTTVELGFKNGATRKDIYDRANELGLDLCPAEVGPALRKAYLDQPSGDDEWILIAMEPIADSRGRLSMFSLDHFDDDERYLATDDGDSYDKWWDNPWVFLLRK